ncbi:MAG: dihydroxyacetone kinase subunit L [Deltaproteobacteria bacterium]|jgi:dihydroxyacetone kinase phosphoprotein-dependent L subunit|nr:dihydroxyacetone kinase subunit L [Deltaproteobacteria bacterium]
MTAYLNPAQIKAMLLETAQIIIDSRDELCRLDSLIGDGDHGVGMSHGFTAAKNKLEFEEAEEAAKLLRVFGMAIISGAGGASGPLFGGLFLEGARVLKGRPALTAAEAVQWWRAALEATKSRGGAKPGDKTMVDALHPAVEAMEALAATPQGADLAAVLAAGARAARAGAEKTKEYVASQGRSRYVGERALGHQDAGATSTAIILETLARFAASAG